MKVARIAVAAVAVLAGLGAAMLVGGGGDPAPVTVVQPQVEMRGPPTTEVLVASTEIPIGGTLTERNADWRPWPDNAVGPHFIRRSDRPNAREELRGAISRFPLASGEPINDTRIIRADRPSFLAAILPAGSRALSVPITADTGAGGFILPNDRVDVILTRRERNGANNQDMFVTETILTNIRVMAIDQTIQERDGEKTVVGRTATMEVQPRQAETLALARQMGELSLALRSLADGASPATADAELGRGGGGTISIVRYGITSQVPVLGR